MLNRLLSPQISVQISLVAEDPLLILHDKLHPSTLDVFPSSQYVDKVLNRFPSPQNSVQVSGVVDVPPDQIHPVSTLHVALHPSPFDIFPSFQKVARLEYNFPSPQVSLQTSGAVEDPPDQVNPVSILQVELHPSPSDVLPSSHCSDPIL